MGYWNDDDYEAPTEFKEDTEYSKRELGDITDMILREDARSELCRECGDSGEKTGEIKTVPQDTKDEQGRILALEFPQFRCQNGHEWYEGEGKTRGIGGDHPILFEEHFQQRRKREIYTTMGTPDPSIVAGIYNRTHPQGRKVNSLEQRRKNGASWYRAVDPVTVGLLTIAIQHFFR